MQTFEIILWLWIIVGVVLAVLFEQKHKNENIKAVIAVIGIIWTLGGMIGIIFLGNSASYKSEITKEINIVDYEIIQYPTRGDYNYKLAYMTEDELEVIDISHIDINYSSDKSNISIYTSEINDKLGLETYRVVINTHKEKDEVELDIIENINN